MPKLNVKQNNSNVIKAFQVALETGHRNLLDNPWWGSGEVVNQRGFTSGQTTNNAYCIDRWKTSYGSTAGTISLGANGLTITAASGTYALINQVIERYSALSGKTVTASALLSNGTIVSGTVANLNWANNPIVVTSGNVRLQLLSGGYFRVTILNGGSATIRAVKLELGSYSTLANDVPPDYSEELRKCQYYYRELKAIAATYLAQGVSVAGTNFRVILPYTMRTRPSVTYSGTLTAYYSGGNAPVTAISVAGTISDAVQLSFTTSGISGANQPVSLDAAAGAKICLSAEP